MMRCIFNALFSTQSQFIYCANVWKSCSVGWAKSAICDVPFWLLWSTAEEGRTAQADSADEFDGHRRLSAVEWRVVRQPRVPQPRVHRRHERLRARPHQTAATAISQSLVHQGTIFPIPRILSVRFVRISEWTPMLADCTSASVFLSQLDADVQMYSQPGEWQW